MLRPTSVTVFGVLNIVFAIWGAVGLVFSAVIIFSGLFDEAMHAMPTNPVGAGLQKFSIVWGSVGSVILLVAGIGLLRMRPGLASSRLSTPW